MITSICTVPAIRLNCCSFSARTRENRHEIEQKKIKLNKLNVQYFPYRGKWWVIFSFESFTHTSWGQDPYRASYIFAWCLPGTSVSRYQLETVLNYWYRLRLHFLWSLGKRWSEFCKKSCSNSHLLAPFIWSQSLEAMIISANIISRHRPVRFFTAGGSTVRKMLMHKIVSSGWVTLWHARPSHTLRALHICSAGMYTLILALLNIKLCHSRESTIHPVHESISTVQAAIRNPHYTQVHLWLQMF